MTDTPPDEAIDMIEALKLPKLRDLEPSENLGEIPEFRWVSTAALKVDRAYQRRTDNGRSYGVIRKIVDEFNWAKFQPITVTPAADGYNVIDGQHRAIGACLHPKVETVPCWIVATASQVAQAKAFVGINRDRTGLTQIQIYNAELAAGDPDATQIDKICRAAGVTVARYQKTVKDMAPGEIVAVSKLRDLIAKFGEGPVQWALSCMAVAWDGAPGQMRSQIIAGVVLIAARWRKTIDRDRFIRVLSQQEAEEMLIAARSFKDVCGGKIDRAIAATLINAYDKRLSADKQLRGLD